MKNILVIDSRKKFDRSLFGLFLDLGPGISWFGWLGDKDFLAGFKALGPAENKFFGPASGPAFPLLLPLLWAAYYFQLYFFQRRNGRAKIICVGGREKIIFTPLAALLRISVIWIDLPGEKEKISPVWLKFFSGPAEIVVFTAVRAGELQEAGFDRKKVSNISLGVNLNAVDRQDDIFFNLAKTDKPYAFFKNFTIGSVVGQADRRRLELLLQAAKKCVNLIPNLRLVMIGLAPRGSDPAWLVKRMGLENRVWLVGEQKNNFRWFGDFDLYFALPEEPGLADLENVLAAASCGAPVVAFREKDLSDLILEGETGFWAEGESAEALAQTILAIEADQPRRLAVGANGKKMAHGRFGRERQIKRLAEIINR